MIQCSSKKNEKKLHCRRTLTHILMGAIKKNIAIKWIKNISNRKSEMPKRATSKRAASYILVQSIKSIYSGFDLNQMNFSIFAIVANICIIAAISTFYFQWVIFLFYYWAWALRCRHIDLIGQMWAILYKKNSVVFSSLSVLFSLLTFPLIFLFFVVVKLMLTFSLRAFWYHDKCGRGSMKIIFL